MGKKAVRVFLDSNVIISGLLSEKGAPRIILDILSLRLPQILGMTGKYNLLETEKTLSRKLPEVLPIYKKYLSKINLKIIPLPSKKEIGPFCDLISEKDAPVLASAVMGHADFLVTGDKKDFMKLRKGNLPFANVTPSEFISQIVEKIIAER